MKKLLFAVVGLCLVAGSAKAACVLGSFCADDTGASVNGQLMDGNGWVLPSATKASILAAAPKAKGQMVMCSDCLFAQTVCISTSALASPATNQYVVLVGTNSACH